MLEALEHILENLDASFDELAAHLDAVGATTLAEDKPEVIGDYVELLDRIRKVVKSGKTSLEKAYDKVSEHFAEVLFHNELMPYRDHPKATFSPSARGFFSVKDAHKFMAWLLLRKEGKGDPFQMLVDATTSKRVLREICEKLFEDGQKLPAGVGGHIVKRVTIRRKRKGKTNDEQGQEEGQGEF